MCKSYVCKSAKRLGKIFTGKEINAHRKSTAEILFVLLTISATCEEYLILRQGKI